MLHGYLNKGVSKNSILHRGSRVRFRNNGREVRRRPATFNSRDKFLRIFLEFMNAIDVPELVHLDIEQHFRVVAVLAFSGSIFNSIHELNHCFDGIGIILCKVYRIFVGFLINTTVRLFLTRKFKIKRKKKNSPSSCR